MDLLHQASDKRGEDLVDPTEHTKLTRLPNKVRKGASLFAGKVVNADPRPNQDNRTTFEGITAKQIYKVAPSNAPGEVPKSKSIFMVKPYHEDFNGNFFTGAHYPIAGWSEMATQALYHAGELGHMAHKVHAFLDPKVENRPLLAVELENGFNTIEDHATNNDDINLSSKNMVDLGKMGVMDFLTNHQDRHSCNLLHKNGEFVAIDNGRSFGYVLPNRFAFLSTSSRDKLHAYMMSPAHRDVFDCDPNAIRKGYDNEHLSEIFKWWKKKAPAIRREWKNQLGMIKDVHVKEWLNKNFRLRANVLDKMAKDAIHSIKDFSIRSQPYGVSVLRNKHGEKHFGYGEHSDENMFI